METKKGLVLCLLVLGVWFSITSITGLPAPDAKGSDGNNTRDCPECHTKGQLPVVAADTINLSACYKCHREGVEFSIPISVQVHGYHEGNRSMPYPPLDYIARHPESAGSACSACHINPGDKPKDCKNCHVSGMHIENNRDKECQSCHGMTSDLFRHPAINLITHEIFANRSCDMCHSKDRLSLQLINGAGVSVSKASDLCRQCHFGTYRAWAANSHHSKDECTTCHNPHSPKTG